MQLLLRRYGESWRRADTILAIVLNGLSVVVIIEANRLPPPFFDPLGSAAVPRSVATLLIVLSACLLVRCLLQPLEGQRRADAAEGTNSPGIALSAAVLPILYVGVMQFGILGFAPASVLFVMSLGGALARWRPMALVALLPVALLAGFGLEALLTEFFYIDLPQQSFWMGAH